MIAVSYREDGEPFAIVYHDPDPIVAPVWFIGYLQWQIHTGRRTGPEFIPYQDRRPGLFNWRKNRFTTEEEKMFDQIAREAERNMMKAKRTTHRSNLAAAKTGRKACEAVESTCKAQPAGDQPVNVFQEEAKQARENLAAILFRRHRR
jgi:hypothetical protein